MTTRIILRTIISLSILNFAVAFAEDKAPTPTPLPKSGSLASSFAGGQNAGTSDKSWGTNVLDQEPAPIAGSVSKDGNKWVAKVFNNSKDTYSADVKIIQSNDRGGSAKNDYFSVSLRPGQSDSRSFASANGAINASLELTRWKKIGGEAKPEDTTKTGASASNAAAPTAVVKR